MQLFHFTGWLEPILDRFRINRNRLVWPKVMGINPDTLQIRTNNKSIGAIGGFDWNMNFKWITDIKKHEKMTNTTSSKWEPKRSVTTIGALHAISKDFFMHLGMYDPEFGIWGGEDVELGIKVWMCGGEVEYVPCSSAFHMFKRGHSYQVTMKQYRWNTDRIAETWLDDEYKKYYYRSVGHSKNRDFGDVSKRLEIKRKIGCKSFDWFIKNVYPDISIPEKIRDPITTPPTTTVKTTREFVRALPTFPTIAPIAPTVKTVNSTEEKVMEKIENVEIPAVINNTLN